MLEDDNNEELQRDRISRFSRFSISQKILPSSHLLHDMNLTMIFRPLAESDLLVIQPITDAFEEKDYLQANRKYTIRNTKGTTLYYALEKSNLCLRACCGRRRPYTVSILDTNLREVMVLKRPAMADCCFFFCCLQKLEVFAPRGSLIARIEQELSICRPKYCIKIPSGEQIFRIFGPCCTTSWCGSDVGFQIMSNDKTEQVGLISNQWSGLLKDLFNVDTVLGISFTIRLEGRVKAMLLAACFLLDSLFYETQFAS